jgi:SET domain-containing protein
MLLVRTYLAKSKINGIGLFAAARIPAGTEVWRKVNDIDIEFKPETVLGMPLLYQEFLRHFCLIDKGSYLLCGDNSRFINHSLNANICEEDSTGTLMIAAIDIEPNEEITENYFITEPSYPLMIAD